MYNDIEKVLITKDEIQNRVKELARTISNDYNGLKPLVVCILKGSIFFTTDLLREFSIPVQIDFMAVSSYGASTKSSGELKIKKDLSENVEGKHVIIVEDIVDSGNTLYNLKKLLQSRNVASVKIATLLDKPDRRVADIDVDYCGFTIPDEFVVGYGLDYAEDYRELPEVCVLKRSVYEK